MSQFGNRGQNSPQPKGILKKPARPPAGSPCASGMSTTDKLKVLMEQFAPSTDLNGVRPRNRSAHQASVAQSSPERKSASADSVNSSDLDELTFEPEHQILEPVPTISKCQACWKPLGEFEGCILRNCQEHVVCKSCLYHEVKDAEGVNKKPTCPVDTCRALIRRDELEAIRNEDQTNSREPEATQKDDKRPTSSHFDESEEIALSEEILLPREHDTLIVAAAGRCDKCEKLVDKNEYLDLRKCKKKHKICFECILATVKISKNLVRCPLYRECKSMMARDEVLHAKYEMKMDTGKQQRESPSKSKAKAKKYIYPNGLPSRDLWPVLTNTTCNKCGRDINVLNGIVIKQCNVHCVCVKCVREKIALNRKLVECPMYISCKSMMMEDEVEAFIERFGGPSGL